MKGQITHLVNHKGSIEQATTAQDSFNRCGWDITLEEGYTPATYTTHPNQYDVMEHGRLSRFPLESQLKADTKRACVMNHVRFWEKVCFANEPMTFIEHDAISINPISPWHFNEVLILNMEYAFDFGALKGKFSNHWLPRPSLIQQVRKLPSNYPLICKVPQSPYLGAKMMCGTAAYAITPKAAKKMLDVCAKKGLEQSDYIINDMNVSLEYVSPSPVSFNSKNLKTSHG